MPLPKKAIKKSKKVDDEDYDIDLEASEKLDEISDKEEEEDEDKFEDDDDDELKDQEELELEKSNKKCLIEDVIDDDNEYFDNNEDIEMIQDTSIEYVKKEDRVSAARLTKYEMVRILGERTKQLTMGAKPLIKNHKNMPYDKIAEEELKLNMIPFKIRRPLPNGKFEIWTLDELSKEHLLFYLE